MKKIVVLPGGFHPFHAGHLALYKQALAKFKDADVYMAASDNQKDRPFPFKVKQLLATEVAGIPKNRFVQVSGSPFQPDVITNNYTSTEDALIFIRSDKDRKTGPLPDQIRKSDGKMGYYISYPLGKDPALEPFADHAYIDYLDVVPFAGGMTSATEIRNAWPKLDELGKIELIKGMYPEEEMTVPKVKKISQILDSVLMGELVESFVSPEQLDEGLKEKLAVGILALGLQFGKTNAEEIFVYQDTQGQYVTAYSKEDVPDTSDLVYYIDNETDKDGNDIIGDKKWLRFPANLAASDAKWFLKNLPTPKPEYVQKAIDELRASGNFNISEAFVDPDQSKQYWNHDAQKVGVGMMIDMPLTDKPNLNGRRQGYNEGDDAEILDEFAFLAPAVWTAARVAAPWLARTGWSMLKGATKVAVRNPKSSIALGVGGAYKDEIEAVAEYLKGIGETIEPVLKYAKQYALPVMAVFALMYGGKKIIDMVKNEDPETVTESDEIPVIYEKTVEALVSKFEGHESDFKSREELADSIEEKLSHLRVPDVIDPKFEVHGQPIGNYSSGRVIEVVSSNDVVDAVMQQLDYYDREDERNYVSEGVGKDIALGALTLGALAGGVANATDITYDDIFNKHYTAEIEKMEKLGHNLTDRDADGYNPSLKRMAKRKAEFKAKIEIKKLSPTNSPIAKQIEKTRTELPQTNFDNYMPSRINESINKIRGMIKETTDEQKSKSVHLHRKLFELMEEEKKNNVVKLRGFGREVDKPIPDLNRVRAEKEKEQERENNYYSERRAEQEELLARLQAELLNAKQEFSELADAQLLPIEMLDTMESITKLIDYIENWEGSEAQNNFPFTESILEKLQLKTVQLKEYFGGMRDTSAPRVLRKQTPKLSPKAFWNTIDLSETADYIEEK